MDISAKTKDHPDAVTCQYDVPESLSELVARFGEGVVVSAARGSIVIDAQAFMRRHIEKGQEAIQGLLNAWTPGVRQPGTKKSAFDKAAAAIGSLSAEERAELIKKLKGAK